MFVVTALHTKRRPPVSIDKFSAAIRKQCIERLLAESYSPRHLRPVKRSSLSSSQAACRVSEPRLTMTRNDNDRDARNRNELDRRPPILKVPPGRPAPTRIRKFIPKPLILVERMKARQLLFEPSPSVALESCVAPESLNRPTTAMTAPLSTHVTPTTHRIMSCSVLSSNSHSSSSVSFRVTSRNDVVFGSGFGMIPRSVRPLSVVTLADSSSSTDTFVADSPCNIKQASSKFPVFAITNVHLDAEPGPDQKSVSDTGVPLLPADFVRRTCESTDTFKPVKTSTPLAPHRANINHDPSPTTFIISTVCSTCRSEQTPEFSDSTKIVPPTSREVYLFNAPKGAYIVKLPNSGSTVPLSNRTGLASSPSTAMPYSRLAKSDAPPATFANAPKPALGFKRLLSRVASPSPTLVLDGVFVLPSPSSSSSPQTILNGFPRPRKPTSRRPLSDISNALSIVPPSQPLSTSPTASSLGQSGVESPRSKLAHVLTAHVGPQTITRTRKRARVPPLVRGVQVSNDPRTQCEIEGLRVRKTVGLRRGGRDSGGRRAIEQMSLASVGLVAKLRARWEAGAVEHDGGADGCA